MLKSFLHFWMTSKLRDKIQARPVNFHLNFGSLKDKSSYFKYFV